jgi:hypothetical protein
MYLILSAALGPRVYSASDINEYPKNYSENTYTKMTTSSDSTSLPNIVIGSVHA